MHSQHDPRLVSVSLPIGGKRETDGNQTGNSEETKPPYLCRIGNGTNPDDRNGGSIFGVSRFQGLTLIGVFPLRSTRA